MVRFSLLMPVYNTEKYVRQAIESVLSQTFTNYELIVIDDGSTDGSVEVLKSYGTRIKLIQQCNQGPEVARNKAAALAQGEYLMMLDSDDLLLPHAMATYDRIIRAFDSPPLVLGRQTYIRNNQTVPSEANVSHPVEVIRYQDFFAKDKSLGILSGKIVIRKSVFEEVGGYRNSTPQTWANDDQNLILKVGTYGPCIAVQKPYTWIYRQHETNSVRNTKAITDGLSFLLRSERQGQYPGGRERRLDRYAMLGGLCSNWAVRSCWGQGHRKMALQIFWMTAPMICAAIWKKALRCFCKPVQPIVLPEG